MVFGGDNGLVSGKQGSWMIGKNVLTTKYYCRPDNDEGASPEKE